MQIFFRYCTRYRIKTCADWWQRRSKLKIGPDIVYSFLRYQRKYSISGVAKKGKFEYRGRYSNFSSISNKCLRYWRFMMTISNKTSISGTISVTMSGTMYSFDFWCLLQDQILSIAIPPAKIPTVIWLMNSQWMRMNALIMLIKSLYHPLHSNCTRYRIWYHTSSTYNIWASSTIACTRAAVATFLWPARRRNWSRTINGSECWRTRPGFGWQAISNILAFWILN